MERVYHNDDFSISISIVHWDNNPEELMISLDTLRTLGLPSAYWCSPPLGKSIEPDNAIQLSFYQIRGGEVTNIALGWVSDGMQTAIQVVDVSSPVEKVLFTWREFSPSELHDAFSAASDAYDRLKINK